MSPSKSLGARIRAARKRKGWSQQTLAAKAGVGGTNSGGRIKMVQRLEADEVTSADVVAKVLHVLEIDREPKPDDPEAAALVPDDAATKVARRRPKRLLVTDGQACVAALMTLDRDGWKFVNVELSNDIGDDDAIDEAMLKIAGVVDGFRARGCAPRDPALALAGRSGSRLSVADRYAYGRDLRKAAAALRERGLELWLVDEWVDFEEVATSFFTRRFHVAAKAAE